jgi:hypothetical protein
VNILYQVFPKASSYLIFMRLPEVGDTVLTVWMKKLKFKEPK